MTNSSHQKVLTLAGQTALIPISEGYKNVVAFLIAIFSIDFAMNAASTSQAAEQVTSCDLFRKRFLKAPRVLSLRLVLL